MKRFVKTYHFDEDFYLDELDSLTEHNVKREYEKTGEVEVGVSSAYQMMLVRRKQEEDSKKIDELEHAVKFLKRKLTISLFVNLLCFLFLFVVFILSVQKILTVISAL